MQKLNGKEKVILWSGLSYSLLGMFFLVLPQIKDWLPGWLIGASVIIGALNLLIAPIILIYVVSGKLPIFALGFPEALLITFWTAGIHRHIGTASLVLAILIWLVGTVKGYRDSKISANR